MGSISRTLAGAVLLLTAGIGSGSAEVEQRLARSIQLPAAAVDVVTSPDGQRMFVLLPGGTVQIYDGAGNSLGQLSLPADTTAIAASPDGNALFATAGDELQVIAVEWVHQLDVADSPTRGPADAAVTVAVFNDFQ